LFRMASSCIVSNFLNFSGVYVESVERNGIFFIITYPSNTNNKSYIDAHTHIKELPNNYAHFNCFFFNDVALRSTPDNHRGDHDMRHPKRYSIMGWYII